MNIFKTNFKKIVPEKKKKKLRKEERNIWSSIETLVEMFTPFMTLTPDYSYYQRSSWEPAVKAHIAGFLFHVKDRD